MAIGPELPPHLVKRKRDSDDSESDQDKSPGPEKRTRTIGPALPPSVSRPSTNPDEIGLNDSDDERPSAPQTYPSKSLAATRVAGPSMPPHLSQPTSNNPDEIDLESDDDGPLPAGPSLPAPIPTPTKRAPRVMGPSMPPPSSTAPADSSSDDDDMGPAPMPSNNTQAARSVFDDPSRATASAEPSGPQRDSWMLAPPGASDWTGRVDPTKLRNRRFASGPRAGGSAGGKPAGMGAEWTETPEEKRRRLANAVMGVADKDGSSGGKTVDTASDSTGSRRAREDRETERRMREYNEAHRKESLVQQHRRRNGGREVEEDDPSKRAFSWEKDMRAPQISQTQRKEMIDRAADFGSRFSKGSYL